MSIYFQTNYASLVAENNLNAINAQQTKTIQQLTSGYRINQSGDDAAGLAIANKYDSSVAELTQGVLNGNNGVSQLQIADGGLSNITTILNRLKTLATESASTTFSGDRSNINTEYQQLVSEVTQQASNIGLAQNGVYNVVNQVYIGGGNTAANSQVTIDLSGSQNQVDANGLGIANTTVAGGGVGLTGGTVNSVLLSDPVTAFLAGSNTQVLTFNIGSPTGNQQVAVTLSGGVSGLSGQGVVNALNNNTQLAALGISAAIGQDGKLQLSGEAAFSVSAAAASGGNAAVTSGATAVNTGDYNVTSTGFAAITAGTETIVFQNAAGSTSVNLTSANAGSTAQALATINSQLSGTGIYAVEAPNTTDISFQSASSFNVNETANATGDLFGLATPGPVAVTAPTATSSATSNALAAITSIDAALSQLGQVQSRVGAGENKLSYAISLANSQITNYDATEAGIKDTDVAAAAAELTKAQVLQQASVAALAQANSAPQSLLKLFQ